MASVQPERTVRVGLDRADIACVDPLLNDYWVTVGTWAHGDDQRLPRP